MTYPTLDLRKKRYYWEIEKKEPRAIVEEKASELDKAIEGLTVGIGLGIAILAGCLVTRALIRAFFGI